MIDNRSFQTPLESSLDVHAFATCVSAHNSVATVEIDVFWKNWVMNAKEIS